MNGPASSAGDDRLSKSESERLCRAAQRLSFASDADGSAIALWPARSDGLLAARVRSSACGIIPGQSSTRDKTCVTASTEVEAVQARLGRADLRPASYNSESRSSPRCSG